MFEWLCWCSCLIWIFVIIAMTLWVCSQFHLVYIKRRKDQWLDSWVGFSHLWACCFLSSQCSSGYIFKGRCPKVMKVLWMKIDFCIFHMPLESPSYLLWFGSYDLYKLKFLHCLGVWTVLDCVLFPTNVTWESGKVLYTKVVENFISFLAK